MQAGKQRWDRTPTWAAGRAEVGESIPFGHNSLSCSDPSGVSQQRLLAWRRELYKIFAADDVNGPKAYQGAISGVVAGTTLSLGVSWVKATFVAGVVAAAVALLPARNGEEVEADLEKEGRTPSVQKHA